MSHRKCGQVEDETRINEDHRRISTNIDTRVEKEHIAYIAVN